MRIPAVLLATACLAALAASATACSGGSKTPATAPSGAAGGTGSSGASPGGSSGHVLNACALLSVTQASSLAGNHYSTAESQVIAHGQDQCTYKRTGGADLVVIVYQPDSGVTWQMMTSVLKGAGPVKSVSGVGDKAMVGAIELDAQAGSQIVAIQGAGGTLTGDYSAPSAIARAVIAALH